MNKIVTEVDLYCHITGQMRRSVLIDEGGLMDVIVSTAAAAYQLCRDGGYVMSLEEHSDTEALFLSEALTELASESLTDQGRELFYRRLTERLPEVPVAKIIGLINRFLIGTGEFDRKGLIVETEVDGGLMLVTTDKGRLELGMEVAIPQDRELYRGLRKQRPVLRPRKSL